MGYDEKYFTIKISMIEKTSSNMSNVVRIKLRFDH